MVTALSFASFALALAPDRSTDADLVQLRAGVATVEADLQSIRLALGQAGVDVQVGQRIVRDPVRQVSHEAVGPSVSPIADPVWGGLAVLLLCALLIGLKVTPRWRRANAAAAAPAADRTRSRGKRGRADDMLDRRSEPPPSAITTTMTPIELKSVLTGATLTVGDRMGAVAEAELFLSYGRTHQAEQVLREAIEHNPADMECVLCLLEILASGRQVNAFNELATVAQRNAGDRGPIWKQIASLGRTVDPANPRYQQERTSTSPQVWVNFLPGQSAQAGTARGRALTQR
jgi:hypothetical protein